MDQLSSASRNIKYFVGRLRLYFGRDNVWARSRATKSWKDSYGSAVSPIVHACNRRAVKRQMAGVRAFRRESAVSYLQGLKPPSNS